MIAILKQIVDRWFLMEPALFNIFCRQHLVENPVMDCAIRCGKGRVEYNPGRISQIADNEEHVEEMLRLEMIRLFLKHPYERQPECSLPAALSLGSDMVIDQHYLLPHLNIPKSSEFQLPQRECFEWYVRQFNELLQQPSMPDEKREPGSDDFGKSDNDTDEQNDFMLAGNGKEPPSSHTGIEGFLLSDDELGELSAQSELWENDDLRREEINNLIRNTTDWGSLSGNLIEKIIASLEVKLDYRKVISSFHTSILSSKRRLTRMRPNRRNGFLQMGSIYDLASKLLVAVDVSGSIDNRTLQAFYSVIARFFKYGMESIDVVQFDVGMREVSTFKKKQPQIDVEGRGGTEFQSLFDYIKDKRWYDGLIIFTDGYASEPKVEFRMRTKVLWVCRSESDYKRHVDWMKKTGKVCWIEF